MTKDDDTAALIERAKDLVSKATPGPWYRLESPWLPPKCGIAVLAGSPDPHVGTWVADLDWPMLDDGDRKGDDWNDAALIAAAPTLITDLTAALERAQADAARMRGFGIPRSARALAIAACDALGLSHADDFDFDAVERAIEMELDVSNISQGDVAIVVVARAALEPRPSQEKDQ